MGSELRPTGRSLYMNTIVFAVVAAIVTVVLLVFSIFVPGASNYKWLIVTVEVGLLGVVIFAILRINKIQQDKADTMANAMENVVPADTCPDYFTAERTTDGSKKCINTYTAPRTGEKFKFVEQPPDRGVPDTILLKNIDGRKLKDMCAIVDPTEKDKENYNIPWTELRAKCSSLGAMI